MKRVAAGLDAGMNARLKPHGLDLSHFAVLMTVLERSPLSQAEIAAHLRTEAYRVSRALDHLEKKALVSRDPDPASRRALVIRPTTAGEALAPTLYQIVRETNAALTAPLSDAERAQLADMLSRIRLAQDDHADCID